MRFRLLEYCCRIWGDALLADNKRRELPPIVPVVFYQGRRRWRHAREFGELFAEAVREWPWTPRFEHLLVDQSQAAVGEVRGEALGRVAQLALMAAARRRVSQGRAALLMAAQYMGELARSGRIELFGAIVRYVITTQDKQTVREFGEALRRHVPGTGGDMKTYAEELLQEGLRKGRHEGLGQEGRHEGRSSRRLPVSPGRALRRRLEESDPTDLRAARRGGGSLGGRSPGRASEGPSGRSTGHDRELLAGRNRVVGHQGGYRYRPGSLPGTLRHPRRLEAVGPATTE